MKKMYKGLILAAVMLALFAALAFGDTVTRTIQVAFNSVNLTVNGHNIAADNILYDGRTYVPLRAVADALGKDVGWDPVTRTASINDKNYTPTVPTPPVTVQPSTSRMSAAEARQTVTNRFGGIIQKIEYTYNESNPLYKGEALKDGSRVVFELNARTGSMEKWDVGNDNSWDSFSHAIPNMITMNQAASSVINKSGNSDTFVQKIDFLWDDSQPLYQGEAFNRGVKYSFEIYAYGGGYQKWDPSYGDDTWAEKYYNVK